MFSVQCRFLWRMSKQQQHHRVLLVQPSGGQLTAGSPFLWRMSKQQQHHRVLLVQPSGGQLTAGSHAANFSAAPLCVLAFSACEASAGLALLVAKFDELHVSLHFWSKYLSTGFIFDFPKPMLKPPSQAQYFYGSSAIAWQPEAVAAVGY
ncbi:hypothetical protein CRUP_000080 [Coryphaenoides rupestris]|nr:hypothetical protein CRUP_000080 [Coryphaenoides rupestris]